MQILKASETGERTMLTRIVKLSLETIHVETGLGWAPGSRAGPPTAAPELHRAHSLLLLNAH